MESEQEGQTAIKGGLKWHKINHNITIQCFKNRYSNTKYNVTNLYIFYIFLHPNSTSLLFPPGQQYGYTKCRFVSRENPACACCDQFSLIHP